MEVKSVIQMNELAETPANGDFLHIIDISETSAELKDKKITIENFKGIIGEPANVAMNSAPANLGVSGLTSYETLGETVAAFSVCRMGSSAGKSVKAKADAEANCPAEMLVVESGDADQSKKVIRQGYARNDAWSWTPGGLLYLSPATAGAMTQTRPSTAGQQVQILGRAKTATVIYFNPQLVVVQV